MVSPYDETTPTIDNPTQGLQEKLDASTYGNAQKFPPTPADASRIRGYEFYERLFLGNHFDAFNIKIDDPQFSRAYSRLRYVAVNFAGLVSKVVADMLFGETVSAKVEEGDQEFIDALWHENHLDTQLFESALTNSFMGDDLFKLRSGERNPGDNKITAIIEEITPVIYFPKIDGFNVRAEPKEKILAWTFKIADAVYLRQEIHKPGLIENKVFKMEGEKIKNEVDIGILGLDLQPVQLTGVDFSLVNHVVNWKTGNRHFGISDYFDLETIFYAINNRMTAVDNILDKHSDPILMVPPGILDDDGKVKKKALGVIELGEGETGKPEYIVWDASLENAFKEIEKLVEFMYMIGEVSPDVLGLGEGVSDSGRALKFKLMRTIAKVSRKKLYYDQALKNVLYKAQVFAQANGLVVGGRWLEGEPVVPEIVWNDGLPIDAHEQIEDEVAMVDAGLKSKKAAIMALNQVDEDTAEEMLKEADDEAKLEMPVMTARPNFPGQKPMPGKPNPKNVK